MPDGNVVIDASFHEDPYLVKSIELSASEIVMDVGDRTTLSYTLCPYYAQEESVIWSSNNTVIVEVNESGMLTAKKAGKCTITATVASNPEAKDSCEVTVIQPVTGITLSESTLEMSQLGEMKQLVANVLPEDASNKTVKWTSSNTAVCTISENGTVVATGYGTATIVATTVDGGFPAACVVTVSQPITITAKSYSRVYGAPNPRFEYTVDGNGLNGIPQITCVATETSSVGIYPIVITKGSVTNSQVSYVNGTLTITKAPLTVSTKDYTRAFGEENPNFELNYTGFANDETESVLTSKPKATTTATANTDVGVYDITVSGGVAVNYDFSYVGGKLTIEKAYQSLTWNQDFSDVKQYEQIELTATASSGLDITYTVVGNQICSVYKIGNKQYVDCTGTGEAMIEAVQNGNKNYWQSTKIQKPIVIKPVSTMVNSVFTDNEGNVKIYDVAGNRIKKLQKGINIIRMSDGTTRKKYVK